MKLKGEHYSYIDKSLKLYGVKSEDLRQDLVDHISTYIETKDGGNFEELFQEALQKFGGYSSFQQLQLEAKMQRFSVSSLRTKAWLYSLSFLSIALVILGSLFKIMHWPGASILLVVGTSTLLFGSLPLFFFNRYQKAKHRLT